MRKKKFSFLVTTVLFASSGFAAEIVDQSYEEFFADKDNQSRYEEMLENGKVDDILSSKRKKCDDMNESDADKSRCFCFFDELTKIDKQIVYFNSLKSFALFMYMVDAKKNGDETEYRRLQTILRNEKPKEIQAIEEKCEKIY